MLPWAGVVFAGPLNGSFAVPLKTTRIWKFNHLGLALMLLGVILCAQAGGRKSNSVLRSNLSTMTCGFAA